MVTTLKKGSFIVSKKPSTGNRISLTLLDHMYLADKKYDSRLTFPATAGEVLRDCCQRCGIALGDATFLNSDYMVMERPENTTYRAVIGSCAMLAGGNARVDHDDLLRIITFDKDTQDIILDGGLFSPWTKGDVTNGGTFRPWTKGSPLDGGYFGDRDGLYVFSAINNLTYDTDDIEVTGIKAVIDETEYMYGSDGYVLTIQNPLIKGNIEDALQMIGGQVVGLTMRPFSLQNIADPTMEFMDPCIFTDMKGNLYFSYITNVDFLFNGYTKASNTTKSLEENAAEFFSGNSVVVEQAKKEAEKLLSGYDIGVRHMNELAANTLGYHYTERNGENGSIIAYRHDKPELSESKIVYKKGIDGFFVTKEYTGDDTTTKWSSGFDYNGDAVLNILYAIGIQAEWINTRGFTAKDNAGNITFRVNADTGEVEIAAAKFSLTGKTIDSIAHDNAASEVNNFITAIYTPAIVNLQAQIDGQIETWYYDYEPTLSNIPASNWKTESDRVKHEGDLFYWKSKGYSYRFFKDGSTWKWQIITDSDITKALADASKAQDTADHKRRVFVATPTPPYDVGDLWVQGANGDIMRCQVARGSGSFISSDWIKASRYTDDSALTAFIGGEFKESIGDLQKQADKKAETWYQTTDPSTIWTTTALKNEHIGDIWFNNSQSVQKSYRWNGTSWVEMKTTPPDAVFDKIDGKAQVFIATPTPPYDVGDLWVQGANGDIMTCVTKRSTGNHTASDWQKRNKYIDQSTANNAAKDAVDGQTQEDILNRLTNNGSDKGIFLADYDNDGKPELYISFNAAHGGTLTLGGSNNGNGAMSILDGNGAQIGKWDKDGFQTIGKQFAVTSEGEVYSNNPTFAGTLYMAGTVAYTLSVPNAERAKAKIMQLGYQTSSGETHGKYTLRIGNVSNESNATAWVVENIELCNPTKVHDTLIVGSLPARTSGSTLTGTTSTAIGVLSSSSERYKDIDKAMQHGEANAIYGITPVWAKYKDGYLSGEDERNGVYFPMLIAEDVEANIPLAANHNGDGTVEDWNQRVIIPYMIQALKEQRLEIDTLKTCINK